MSVTSDAKPMTGKTNEHDVAFSEAVRVWARIAALSFGGPAGQIAVMHRILVEEKRWIGEARFLHALNYCMLLPGPEAQQLAVYIGWLMHRTKGGLLAGTLFILPGFLSILALSYIYVLLGDTQLVDGLFFGLKAAVLAIVVHAVQRIGRRALANRTMMAIAAASFLAIFLFDAPFPLIVLTAGLIGFVGGRSRAEAFSPGGGHGGNGKNAGLSDADSALGEQPPAHARPSARWSLAISGVFATLWLVPVGLLVGVLGFDNVFSRIAVFFSQMAVVTFGGAYAVLAYVAQQAVETYGWLSPGEMLDGLGMAETTPGPLIMVVQFVGFLGAYRDAGALDPLVAATLAAVLTTWVTFVPCFLWIFLGAPYVERLRHNAALTAALSAITAAVVGVILNLAIWFGMHVLFASVGTVDFGALALDLPAFSSVQWGAVLLTAVSIVAVFGLRLSMGWVLVIAATGGIALRFLS